MIQNQNLYENHPKINSFMLCSPVYERPCLDCTSYRGWSSIWTLLALSNVIGKNINSIYPPMNGTADRVHNTLHFVIEPDVHSDYSLYIMWTKQSIHTKGIWTPNHFVPVMTGKITNCSSKKKEADRSDSRLKKQEADQDNSHLKKKSTDQSDRCLKEKDNDDNIGGEHKSEVDDEDEDAIFEITPSMFSTPKTERIFVRTNVEKSKAITQESIVNVQNQEFRTKIVDFMPAEKIFEKLLNKNEIIYDSIPSGLKQNVCFVIRDDENENRRARGKNGKYADDCGVWNSKQGRVVKTVLSKMKITFINLLWFKTKNIAQRKLQAE